MAKLYEYELGKSADMMIRIIGRVVDIRAGIRRWNLSQFLNMDG